jgi:tRNA pseudouridine55 synthase
MNGLLLVDKPKGWTSFDVVAKVRSILRESQKKSILGASNLGPARKIKVGHTGTLDPMATGLLILCIGSATKKAQELTKLDKVYEAEVILGKISATLDSEGPISDFSEYQPSNKEVEKCLAKFVGSQSQTPPAYSAIKINGQRAYKLARQGSTVKLKQREITIYTIYDIDYAYPRLSFTTKVSSGTYIRTLADDIGKALKCGAYLSELRRTKVGDYALGNKTPSASKIDNTKISRNLIFDAYNKPTHS